MLNRAPTLHKLGIQAFYPVLIKVMPSGFIPVSAVVTMLTLTATRWQSMCLYPKLPKPNLLN
jgi:hypothetical protein